MIGAKRSRQAPARPFPSGLMIPNGRKFDGFVAGLFGLGMKHKSASFREDRSISAAGPGRCPNSCSDAVNASPTESEQSLQAAAGAEPCGTALCGRIDPMWFGQQSLRDDGKGGDSVLKGRVLRKDRLHVVAKELQLSWCIQQVAIWPLQLGFDLWGSKA